jgi:hypothetical protein
MDMSGLLPILNHEVGSNPYPVPSTGNLGEPFLSIGLADWINLRSGGDLKGCRTLT